MVGHGKDCGKGCKKGGQGDNCESEERETGWGEDGGTSKDCETG